MDEPAKAAIPTPVPRVRWIERAFKNPVVGMVGWAATVLSLVLAIYFYVAGQERPDLTYFVRSDRTSIVATGDTPGITITYKGHELTKNVSAAQVVLWNAGKKPIRREDVLTPYVISLPSGHPIVTAKIVSVTDPVTEFRLDDTAIQDDRLSIGWRVLEHNDGAIVQVIYEGDTSVPIQLSGVSIGQRSVTLRTQGPGYKTYQEQSAGDKWAIRLALAFFSGISLLTMFLLYKMLAAYSKSWRAVRVVEWFWLIVLFSICVGVTWLTLRAFDTVLNPSPFG